jgi:peptidoglycan/LPS O-acetylase OafA/YrhL
VTGLALRVVKGFVLPTWPNGGWSIAVELHFYILPPLLLIAIARNIWWGVAMIAAALTRRAAIYHSEVPPTLHS